MNDKIKRITFKVSNSFHKAIKQKALDRNTTITRYIMRALWAQITKEKTYEEKEDIITNESNKS